MILWGGNCLPVPHFVQMGLLVLHAYVGGVIYYGDTLWILDMGSCLTLLGPTCLWRGLDRDMVLVPYTGIAWGRLPVAMQNEVVTFGFPR